MAGNVEAVATVEGLVHRYGDLTAIDDLSFSIEHGEVFGLLGPNGAGKSTTISILSCVLERTGGRVGVLGGDAGPNASSIKARVGLVPQELALYEEISGLNNLKFFGRLYGLSGSRLGTAIETALETVGLSDRAGDTVSEYSGGMKRRLNLAAGLLHDPEILILDEPTNDVDPLRRRLLWEQVRRLGDQGAAVLLVTHNVMEAEKSVDRLAVIDDGRLIAEGTPSSLKAEDRGRLRLQVMLAPGTETPDTPALVLQQTRVGNNLMTVIPEDRAGDGIAWARSLVEQDRAEEYALAATTLEDVYIRLVKRANGDGEDEGAG